MARRIKLTQVKDFYEELIVDAVLELLLSGQEE